MTTLAFDVLWRDRGAQAGMEKLGRTAGTAGAALSKTAKIAALGFAAAGVAAVKFGKDSVVAYVEAEQAQVRLQEAYRKFPQLADTNISAMQKLNSQLALKTKFDDDATASGQAVLAQFRLTGRQITELTPLLQDYAAKTGKDLPTAARDLGKAMLGQGRALKNVGIDFKDTGDRGKNFDQIMAGLRRQVGGFAEREGKTAAGQAAILKNQFGELQESVGAKVLPVLLKLGDGLLRLFGFVEKNSALFDSLKRIVSETFGAFSKDVGLGQLSFKKFGDFIETHQEDIVRGFVTTGKAVIAFGKVLATLAGVGLRAFAFLVDSQATFTEQALRQFRLFTRGAALAFGWLPGVGKSLVEADKKFDHFADTAVKGMRDSADGARRMADGIDQKLTPALNSADKALDKVGKREIISARQRDNAKKAELAIRDVKRAADSVPSGRQTRITAPGAAAVAREMRELRSDIGRVPNSKTVRVRVRITSSGDIIINGTRRGSAGGIGAGANGPFLHGVKPVPGRGNRHSGYPWARWAGDFPVGMGTPVHAWRGGRVTATNSWNYSYGKHIRIDHGGGNQTLYAHLSRIGVSPGDRVGSGQVIGRTGSTGNSTGPHLHFEWYRSGGLVSRPSLIGAGEAGPERVLSARQTRAFENWMRVSGSGSGGAVHVTYVVNAPNYVGPLASLERALVDLDRANKLPKPRR